jgi:hypothetical protein
MHISIKLIIIVLCIFGIIFLSFLAHETMHVIHSEGSAQAICLSVGMKINDSHQQGNLLMYTKINKSMLPKDTNYSDWRNHTEKIAGIMTYFLIGANSFILGLFLKSFLEKKS